ncbi:hypothetical protein TVAG_466000 [Trichomonas vaginalis G3]|uniref:Uncharacterized protein n=1 Tax=Trichomonas vaginalis (strain ATCC PRA-98 / G3) TaxID=412133 RepID=A2EX81_TRIV3|nr:armadillo (ARM) repeat-containing protein family [Trichomonas vaginalis G3]EAY02740.1 hypothetical protein TVAG_466000 [Trichomonas vaginalis G3]KAI5517241.1 armadillo (ARM) repeat-containing protein family [Trichomonas vaginalis G3]|eukprot:XP_001314963.1 hypothetical protein [Trichomonas vaginalis G3]
MEYKESDTTEKVQDFKQVDDTPVVRVNKSKIISEILESEACSNWDSVIDKLKLLLSLDVQNEYAINRDDCRLLIRLASNMSVVPVQNLSLELLAKYIAQYRTPAEWFVEFGGLQIFHQKLEDANCVIPCTAIFAAIASTEVGFKACVEMNIFDDLISLGLYFTDNSQDENFSIVILNLLTIYHLLLHKLSKFENHSEILQNLIIIFKKLFDLNFDQIVQYFPLLLKTIDTTEEDPCSVLIDSELIDLVFNGPSIVPPHLRPTMFQSIEQLTALSYDGWNDIILEYIQFSTIMDFIKTLENNHEEYLTCFRIAANLAYIDQSSIQYILIEENTKFFITILEKAVSKAKVYTVSAIFNVIHHGNRNQLSLLFATSLPLQCLDVLDLVNDDKLLQLLDSLYRALDSIGDIITHDKYYEEFREQLPETLQEIQDRLELSDKPSDEKICLFITSMLSDLYPESLLE